MSDCRIARIAGSGPEGRTGASAQETSLQKTRYPTWQAVHADPLVDGPKLPAAIAFKAGSVHPAACRIATWGEGEMTSPGADGAHR